jgi:hypothetical protein
MTPSAIRSFLLLAAAFALVSITAPVTEGRQKKPAPKDAPRIVVAFPLGVLPGASAKLTLRGLKLDEAKEIRCQEPKATARLIGTGKKVGVPDQQDVTKVGDTQAEIELLLPREIGASTVTLTIVTAAGESEPYRILVDQRAAIAEKEPNNGFRQAQAVQVPQEINGMIANAQDVDTFKIEGKAGQKIVGEVFAARYGSSLDSVLTLYNAAGQVLASNDDIDGSTDSRIEVTLPKDGIYYFSVIDAHDQGGPAHVYRLSIRAK